MDGAQSFDAALIAGGRSRRMGRDKAFLDWGGRPLYAEQLRKLASLGPGRLFLSTRAEQDFPAYLGEVIRLRDEPGDLGPLGGLRSILAASSAERVLVLAVDLPSIGPDELRGLLAEGGGAVPRGARGWEPLVAVYPRRPMLALVDDAIAAGRLRLQDLVEEAARHGIVRAIGVEDERPFANLNTPGDFAAIERSTADEALSMVRYRREGGFVRVGDRVAREEPLEIRVNGTPVAVTMRTPGHDAELAAGFLLTEGVLASPDDVLDITHCSDLDPAAAGNVLQVRLRETPDLAGLTRHVFTSSSCGVCGKATIASVVACFPPVARVPEITADLLMSLPAKLRAAQDTFERTGGLHAAALFDVSGELLLLREDVGRHNALDKLIGHFLLRGGGMEGGILLVSGRLSFELIQKSLAARIPVVAAISAPSSLAVDFAKKSGQTVVGFLREQGFNVYNGEESLRSS